MFRPICLALFASLVLAGCGSDPAEVDTTPPSTVQDLAVVAETDTTVTLTWTAPGDDGDEGQAWEYDLRYGAVTLRDNWEAAARVDSLPRPQPVGSAEEMLVTGLPSGSTHFFALKTGDDAGNWSDASNLAAGLTGDSVPPAATTDLVATPLSHKAVQLTWTASGNDGTEGTAAAYYVRYSKSPITEESWAQATAVLGPTPSPAGIPQSFTVSGLDDLTTYYFALKTSDGINTSPISNVALAATPRDTVPPATITDLEVVTTGRAYVTLSWTAPGDDGTEGTVDSYDLRTSTVPLAEATWDAATPADALILPTPTGHSLQVTVHDLEAERTHYFAIRASDERGNASGVSANATATLDTGRSWHVLADGSGDAPTIQAALDAAAEGDLILVGPGRYYEAISFLGKDLVLKSTDGPESTIIDATGKNDSAVIFPGEETRACLIEGFTITGGTGTTEYGGHYGGGIMCAYASPTIRMNVISGNVVRPTGLKSGNGGGICVGKYDMDGPRPEPHVLGNVIRDNAVAGVGGGLFISHPGSGILIEGNDIVANTTDGDGAGMFIENAYASAIHITNNRFVENVASDHGGGVAISHSGLSVGPTHVCGNLFVGNVAVGGGNGDTGAGGAIYTVGQVGSLAHNTIAFNVGEGETPESGGGIVLYRTAQTLVVTHNILAWNDGCGVACRYPEGTQLGVNLFWENSEGAFAESTRTCPESWREHALFADPLFCDPANDDYRVRSDSPALTHPEGPIGAYATPGCSPPASSSRPR